MKYQNPVIRGFYPDPSICQANGRFYLVCSSFQYFPGVPLFESTDLVNWKQIGHCLTRPEQIDLSGAGSSGGVYAPCLRYVNGRFYMTTTNVMTGTNFYIWTDDIYSEWSDPILVDQDGIDPSFYFEEGRVFYMTSGTDEHGVSGILQCEIDIETGNKLSESVLVWTGSGGRYPEGPHLYQMNGYYYLMIAEGGTEYGHMITCARSKNIFGPFENNPQNPFLTNRNLGGFEIQGVGHGDLVRTEDDKLWMVHLGFRQSGKWTTFHHLGREVFLTPVRMNEQGWLEAGEQGTTIHEFEAPAAMAKQELISCQTFENTEIGMDWCYLRNPEMTRYQKMKDTVILTGSASALSNPPGLPVFLGLRQKEFAMQVECKVSLDQGEAGLSVYMDDLHHYDVALLKEDECCQLILRLCIGNLRSVVFQRTLPEMDSVTLRIESDSQSYRFHADLGSERVFLGEGLSKYLSSEVAGGFTGVMTGLYAVSETGTNRAQFYDFKCNYECVN